ELASHSRIAALEDQVQRLLLQLKEKEDQLKQKEDSNLKLQGSVATHRKRARRRQSSLEDDGSQDEESSEHWRDYELSKSKVICQQFETLISKSGGISRLTIFNDKWHDNHKDAARLLWGYNSWAEAKLYVDAYFPSEVDVVDDPFNQIQQKKDGDMIIPTYLSPFEKCMVCRMFFHVFSNQQVIGLIIDRHRTSIGKIVKEWAPKWANVGMDLSCLDITSDYLFKEVPNRNMDLGKPKLVYVDGKDWLISLKGNDNAVAKCTYSSKTEKDSARCLTFSTASGLVFEWSPLFGGRAGERKIVEFMGSLGPQNAPIADWEDVATKNPISSDDDAFWTALTDIMTADEFDDVLKKIEDGDPLVVNGIVDDGVLETGQPTGLAQERLNTDIEDSNKEESMIQCLMMQEDILHQLDMFLE
ncbi:hypothetical protein ACHAXR_002591, partial [Thalassiosira sp. AJA248-18]